jgi:hypothetical protein
MARPPDRLGEELNRRLEKGILPRLGGVGIVAFKMVKRPPSPVSSPPGEDIPWLARQPSNVPTSFPALSRSDFRFLRLRFLAANLCLFVKPASKAFGVSVSPFS